MGASNRIACYAALAVIVAFGGCKQAEPMASPGQQANSEARAEATEHNHLDLRDALAEQDLATLTADWPRQTDRPSVPGDLVLLPIPQPSDLARDGLRWFLYAGDRGEPLWIMKSGGYSGAEWRGPIPDDLNAGGD